MRDHHQPPLFAVEERHVVSPPLIKSPGEVIKVTVEVVLELDSGKLQIAHEAKSALTGELYEWRMPPVVTGREHHGRALAEAWRRFLVMVQEHSAPF